MRRLSLLCFAGVGLVVGGACDVPPASNPPPPIQPIPGVGDCPTPTGTVTLQDVQTRFVADVYPMFARESGGCVACHANDSGRLMRMAQDGPTAAEATFLRLRTGGYLTRDAGSALARVVDDSMPQGGPAWTAAEKGLLDALTCDLARVDDGTEAPLDEQFPPELDLPYTGPAITDYDNAFLSYDQLRGRVVTVFDDDWVRLDVDQFADNISLFGGVDFLSSFVAARQATPEFLAGLDLMAEDVCGRAAELGTGPFAGVDTAAAVVDEPPSTSVSHEAEAATTTIIGLPAGCLPGANATRVVLCTNASLNVSHVFPINGTYRISATVQGAPNTEGPPLMAIRIDGEDMAEVEVPGTTAITIPVEGAVTAGEHTVTVAFTNDSTVGGDRNLFVDRFVIEGPLPGTTNGAVGGTASAKERIKVLAEHILSRPVDATNADDAADLDGLHTVLTEMEAFEGSRTSAFAGVCEALLHHPDFLFTRAGSFDHLDDANALRDRLLVNQSALVLLDRVASADELGRYDVGELSRENLVDEWLQSPAFLDRYRHRVRQILEFDGTPDGDEPSRLWTYLVKEDRPLREVLTADYTVDETLARVERPVEHGQTGVLTMKGYIIGKPGLPHYNYAARVLTGFMGVVFDVPQEALDARATASATSTVDTQSLCFTCHRVLTPLAYQRQRWDDNGVYREVFDDGRVIDDTDQNLVAGYPFRGSGLEAFSLVAVRKEAFARRMANAHFQTVFGRLMRHEQDERTVYRALYDAIDRGDGTFRDLQRAVLLSSSFVNPPRPVVQDGGAP